MVTDDRAGKRAAMERDVAQARLRAMGDPYGPRVPDDPPAPLRTRGSRKARRDGWCRLGTDAVRVGERIGYVDTWGWCHERCVVAANG